jgi:dynein heavy chain
MQDESFKNILTMVEDCYRSNAKLNKVVNDVFSETKLMFNEAMQKSILQNVLVKPDVKGLENETAGPPPVEQE